MSDKVKKLVENLELYNDGELAVLVVHLFSLCCHKDVPEWIKRMAKASVDVVLSSESN